MSELDASLEEWAENTLERIGVYREKVSNFGELRGKVIANLREEYSNRVLEHFLNPKNMRNISDPDGYAKVTGSCGDTMEVYLKLKNGEVTQASFQTDGCIASIASGNMAIEMVKGKTIPEAQIGEDEILEALGGLPEDHVHCALLASNTLKEAVKDCSSENDVR